MWMVGGRVFGPGWSVCGQEQGLGRGVCIRVWGTVV